MEQGQAAADLDGDNFRKRVLRPLLALAKLSHHTIKDLRHTAGTLMAERGTLPQYVQGQSGHHDVAFAMRQYVHLPTGYRNHTACLDDVALPFAPLTPSWTPNGASDSDRASDEKEKGLVDQGLSETRPG